MAFLAPIAGAGLRAVAGRVIGSRVAPMIARAGASIESKAPAGGRLASFGQGLGKITAADGAEYGMQAGLNAPSGGGSQKQNFNQGIDIQSMYGASGS